MLKYDPRAAGARCDLCPLSKRADNVVVPPLPPKKRLRMILVGEGPGRVELRVGEPFVGPSGVLLKQTLEENFPKGFLAPGEDWRGIAHITNTALCQPYTEKEEQLASVCCAPRLLRELRQLDPKIPILALGKPASKAILGTKSILLVRGFVWTAREVEGDQIRAAWGAYRKVKAKGGGKLDATFGLKVRHVAWLKAKILEQRSHLAGRTVLPTLHPAFILRSDMWRPVFDVDINRYVRLATDSKAVKLRDRGPYKVVTSAKKAAQELAKLGDPVAADIETDDVVPLTTKMLCIGISDGKRTVVVMPPSYLADGWERTGLSKVVQDFFERRF
jgi:uracil-DNA glycosylase family 4